ncbi:hypothetical protein [Leisingera sp. ANG-Vp]|uniref:hypothetical protein n=1 Tax=Leisingera sp. ANG-Vp TaxID=1577896 RepID=UPI00057E2430|nr:hypothetical protein [Leisingera sp. ANG-Vp]KIC15015.1 hypothetical protein RA20_19160 [Leisingera sp. ANG-Vp]
MGALEELKAENQQLRKLLNQAQRAGRAVPSRPAPADVAQQLELPDVVRYPLAEFAAGRGHRVPLPESVEEIAEVIGRENAVRLVEGTRPRGRRRWRRQLYVPAEMPEGHRIATLIGLEDATKLSFSHANCILELPSCHGLRKAYLADYVMRLQDQGADEAEIAREIGVEKKTVASLVDEGEYWRPRLQAPE